MAFTLKIGSRPSQLALAQAELVRRHFRAVRPDLPTEIVQIRTSGDRMTNASLAQVGGKGLFIRELEQALIERKIDLAVHSMKDLPAMLEPGFRIAAVPSREDPRDALIARTGSSLENLPGGTTLGTSSLRRRFQALRVNRTLSISPLRGNVDTRLRRVKDGDLDAIIIAIAGIKRLGRDDVRLMALDLKAFVPAGGQAALAVEMLLSHALGDSQELEQALSSLNDTRTSYETSAERAFLAAIGASCATPVGVHATIADQSLAIRAMLFSPDGARELSAEIEDVLDAALALSAARASGEVLAERMLALGADRLIADG